MPQYEWVCRNPHCPQNEFEVKLTVQQIEEGYIPSCPVCDSTPDRLLSSFGGNFGDTEKFHG